jgi:AmmeMemoRadiSam system protein A
MAESFQLTDEQKKTLLNLARAVVESKVAGKSAPAEKSDDPVLKTPCGCFVTLHVDGHLRGCIGTFQAAQPILDTVREMAEAALQDPRFLNQPLRKTDLPRLQIEISVLSPLEKTADPLSLELGKHGIYIRRGYASGCFLPQVATETGWTKEEFLAYCCSHKAGLPADAWKDPKTDVYLFTAEVFGEK